MNEWISSRAMQPRLAVFFFFFITLMTMLYLPTLCHAQVRAFLDRQQIQSYETVELQIEIDEHTSDEPDFSVLKNDFEVSQSRQSSSIRIINGQTSATSQWVVTLSPKRTGTLTIPSFTLSGQSTPELTLEVSEQTAQNASANDTTRLQTQMKNPDPIFLILEFSNPKPYVQEPVLATLKIYHAVTILQGGLSDWTPNNARIQRVQGQTESSDTVDGKPYQITQVYYWITPQQSGTLTLPSLVFQAEVADNSRGGLLSSFGALSSQRITQATPPQHLTVRPQPANYPAHTPWLPAKRIDIQDNWTPSSQQVQVGQAITRNLTVQVTGQWGSLIPDIPYPPQKTLKFYPDQSPPQDQATLQAVTSSKTLSIAIVPTAPGSFQLPTQKLIWWNTQTDQLEYTEIPATSLTVLPTPGQSGPVGPLPQNSTSNTTTGNSTDNSTANTASSNHTATPSPTDRLAAASNLLNTPSSSPIWQWLAIAFGSLWLLTLLLILWLWHRPRAPSSNDTMDSVDDEAPPFNTTQTLTQLKKALDANDLAAIEHALIRWGQAHFQDHDLLSLSDLQQKIKNTHLKQLLRQLNEQRYNPHAASPANPTSLLTHTLHELLPLIKTLSKQPPTKKHRRQTPLPELYPR